MTNKTNKISESKYFSYIFNTIFAFAMILYAATFVVGVRTFAVYTPIFGTMFTVEKYIIFMILSAISIAITIGLFCVNIIGKRLSSVSMIGFFALNIVNVAMPYLMRSFDVRSCLYAYEGYISFVIPLSLLFILGDLSIKKARSVGYSCVVTAMSCAIALFNLVYVIIEKASIGSAIISVGLVPVLSLVTIMICLLQVKYDILSIFGIIRQFVTMALGGFICAFAGISPFARIIFAIVMMLNALMQVYETIRYNKLSKEEII